MAEALAAEGQLTRMTRWCEASTPSLYAPQQCADPKFSRPVADTTRTMTVISEQVIKDQGATNLTDALKNVPGVGAFFAGQNGHSTTGDAIYMRGADTSNSIYIDGIRDISSVSRDTFNTEQVEVIKGPSAPPTAQRTDRLMDMMASSRAMIRALTPPPVLAAPGSPRHAGRRSGHW
ncbi:TonB-dependent receptor plug domain-containing protein [Escherichia coli]